VSGALALVLQTLDDGIADRLRLPPLASVDDDETIGERRDALQVQGDRVLRLPVGGGLQGEQDLCFKLYKRLLSLI
jgi:hypothetical protein